MGIISIALALYLSQSQPTVEQETLGEKSIPKLDLSVVNKTVPKEGAFKFTESQSEYSVPGTIMVRVVNKGMAPTMGISFTIAFNENVKVENIDFIASGMERLMPKYPIFTYANPDYQLAPNFQPISFLDLTIRLRKSDENLIFVGRYSVQAGGEDKASEYKLFYNKQKMVFASQIHPNPEEKMNVTSLK